MKTTSLITIGLVAVLIPCEARTASRESLGVPCRIESPPAQRDLGDLGSSTSSWVERTLSWRDPGWVELDAFVDSQSESDRFEVLVDGVVKASLSGERQMRRLYVPVTAGSHVIRLAYTKDGALDHGLDRAVVDNVAFMMGGAPLAEDGFGQARGCDIPGWTRGGFAGGWCATSGPPERELRTPDMRQEVGVRRAGIQRSFTWPESTRNELKVEYAVDSEAEADVFRIRIDGEQRYIDSGDRRSGRAIVPVSSGPHSVTLEYEKNATTDYGSDQVRILSIVASADGRAFAEGGLLGAPPDVPLEGWSSTPDSSFAFVTSNAAAPRIYLAQSGYSGVTDGFLLDYEYPEKDGISSPNLVQGGRPVGLRVAAGTTGDLFLALPLEDELGAQFVQGGVVTLLLDSEYLNGDRSCGARPHAHSRRIEISRQSSGEITADQYVGACPEDQGEDPWSLATPLDLWQVQTAMVVGAEDGSALLEIAISPTRKPESDQLGPLAFAMRLDVPLPGQGLVPAASIPWREHAAPTDRDISTWEEVHFVASTHTVRHPPKTPVDLYPQTLFE